MAYQFTRYISTFKYTKNSIDIIYEDYININNTHSNEYSNKKFNFKNININNLSFEYPNSNQYVFKNLNLSFKKGQAIGIIGPSGSGKTTIVDILLGLLPYKNGSIMLDNIELNSIKEIQSWRNLFYYMPQEIFIINDTLKRNIALGIDENNIDENKINESIKKANLEIFKNNLKYGIDTQIGERGANISGGQKQRIAIARAIYHFKEILILDEATSSMDKKLEAEIMSSIKSLVKDKICLIVSHNKISFDICSRILEVKDGKIIEI